MAKTTGVASRLAEALAVVLGTKGIPLRLRAWDGSEAGPENAPVLEFRSGGPCDVSFGRPGSWASAGAYEPGTSTRRETFSPASRR